MVTVQILVGSVDITADVMFSSCRFASYVNGKPGDAAMRVRDSGRTYSFTTGADWLVLVNGDAAWRGFLMSKVDTYIAPALNVADFGPTRFFDLVGADMNILFSRRVVYDQADPTVVEGTQFPAATADTTAITELLANWLHLSGDDLDTSGGVTNVGDLDPAQKTRAWSGGWTWGNAMDTIAMLPAAIYYLRPEATSPKATLCYVDVDVPSAPFGLSDTPNHTTTRGYREMEITLDGTSMANDVMAWGMGYGSTVPVFDRETDSTSQSNHGLWQTGVIANGVYKQATIDRIATSIIDGSPSSKRGAKNDKPSVSLVTYEPGLLAGHVVPFTSHIWGFSDDIPVRQMVLLFEAPDVARYEIVLSHEIDAPWGFVDQFLPQTPGLPQIPCYVVPCGPQPPGNPQSTSHCDCGLTDTFTRTVSGGWGTSDSGNPWSTDPTAFVDGSQGCMTVASAGSDFRCGVGLAYPPTWPLDATVLAVFNRAPIDTTLPVSETDAGNAGEGLSLNPGSGTRPYIAVCHVAGVSTMVVNDQSGTQVAAVALGFALTSPFYVNWTLATGTGTLEIRAWSAAASRPSSPTATVSVTTLGAAGFDARLWANGSHPFAGGDITVAFDSLAIAGVDRCTAIQFDDFNRVVPPADSSPTGTEAGGGVATPSGYDWGTTGCTTQNHISVDGTRMIYNWVGTSSLSGLAFVNGDPTVPWLKASWEMTARFTAFRPSGFADAIFTWAVGGFAALTFTMGIDDSVKSFPSPDIPFGWIDGASYLIKWDVTWNGPERFKVWLESDPEPDWLFETGFNDSGVPTSTAFSVALTGSLGSSSTSSLSVDYIDFHYAGRPCYYDGSTPVGPVGTAPTSPGGWGCENPVRVSSTVYQSSLAFVPQTTFVWRNGLFQSRGTDFTEDSGNQSITFSTPVTTEVIRMCYFSQGPAA